MCWGRDLGKGFSVGASLKMIYCGYADYNSFGIAADVAGTYYNEKKRLSVSLLFKNMGSELKPFTPGNFEKPADCPGGVVISAYPPTPTLYPEAREEEAAI